MELRFDAERNNEQNEFSQQIKKYEIEENKPSIDEVMVQNFNIF
jgi:hypothetical protein